MNRKDTIIVAVLINAGLLVMLFVSALKNDSAAQTQEKITISQIQPQAVKKEIPISKSTPDQVDHILAQYSKKLQKEVPKEPTHPVKEEKKVETLAPSAAKVVEAPAIKEKKEIEKPPAQKTLAAKDAPKDPVKEVVKESKKAPKEIASSNHEELIKVVVKKGDVLEKIAKIYGTTVGALMQENQLTDSRLQIGQVLHIPKDRDIPSPKVEAIVQLEEKFYVVKNGDNLWKIAIENHMKVEELLKLNQLSEKQAKALRPGDRLRIQ